MKRQSDIEFGRRGFLKGVAVATGASLSVPVPFVNDGTVAAAQEANTALPGTTTPEIVTTNLPLAEVGYESFGPDEAAFVEAMVDVMCPADDLTPSGVECGLAVYIDRQMAGGFGKGERLYMRGPWRPGKPQQGYQLPLTPEQFFKAGIAAANDAAQKKYGSGFADLASTDADAFLHQLADNKISHARVPLGSWFNELVYPLFLQACFADPIYGGNVGKVFWKMIGYPGLPATYSQDMVDFRGKPHPGAQNPMAIADFS
jgi:gluconate 2-dehydrogenase gamma chain